MTHASRVEPEHGPSRAALDTPCINTNATTAPLVVEAGADVVVAGSAIFGDVGGIERALHRLRASVETVDRMHEGRSGCR